MYNILIGVTESRKSLNGCKATATMFTIGDKTSNTGRQGQRARAACAGAVAAHVSSSSAGRGRDASSDPLAAPMFCCAVCSLAKDLHRRGYEIADHTARHISASDGGAAGAAGAWDREVGVWRQWQEARLPMPLLHECLARLLQLRNKNVGVVEKELRDAKWWLNQTCGIPATGAPAPPLDCATQHLFVACWELHGRSQL